jgi:hypothetical protein
MSKSFAFGETPYAGNPVKRLMVALASADSYGISGEDRGWVKNFTTTPLVLKTVTLLANGGTLAVFGAMLALSTPSGFCQF